MNEEDIKMDGKIGLFCISLIEENQALQKKLDAAIEDRDFQQQVRASQAAMISDMRAKVKELEGKVWIAKEYLGCMSENEARITGSKINSHFADAINNTDIKEEGCRYPDCRGGCCARADGNPVGWKKKECVEPVSIWKPISQLNKDENNNLLVRRSNKKIFLGEHLVGTLYDYNNSHDFCTLTDFINSFEQMQKDIEKLKRNN